MRLESRHQSSTSGTFSLTKKSFPPLSWADKVGSVGAAMRDSTRIVDTRARRPPPSASGSEGDRLPRARARANSRTRLRRPLLPPAPPREGFGFHSPNPPPARRLAQATHSGAPTRRTCRGGNPAPGGPGTREMEAESQAMPERGARWRRPSPSYLPRSHQTRRACGSGSRPYSAAAPAAAAAATCPAVGMQGAWCGVRGEECRLSGKGCGKRGAGRRMRSERPAQAAVASRAVGTKRRAGAGTKSAAPPPPGRPPGCADSSAALPPPGRPPGCARSSAAPAREPGATLSASGPRSGFSPAAAGGRPEAARAEEEGKEGTGGGSTQGARRTSSAPRAACRRGRGGHCRRAQSRRAAWRRGRGPAPPRRTHRS